MSLVGGLGQIFTASLPPLIEGGDVPRNSPPPAVREAGAMSPPPPVVEPGTALQAPKTASELTQQARADYIAHIAYELVAGSAYDRPGVPKLPKFG